MSAACHVLTSLGVLHHDIQFVALNKRLLVFDDVEVAEMA